MLRGSRWLPARWLPAFVVLLAVTAAVPVHADEAADAWALGREAYASGDYGRALAAFERARDAGQQGPAVRYNIAVCHYQLGDYEAARQGFAALGENFAAMRALAEYNLGLVALKLSEPSTAASHFRGSYVLAEDDPKLRSMASTQLGRLEDAVDARAEWLRLFSARAGYDDNVILQDEPALTSELSASSPFLEAWGTLRGPYPSWNGVRFDGGFLLLRYPDVDPFNQASLRAGALYEWRRGDWRAEAGAHLGTTTLGGDGYDRSVRLTARAAYRLDADNEIAARLRYDDVTPIDSVFDGIDGSRQRFDLHYRRYRGDHYLRVGLARETNDRDDPNVSPDRTGLHADYRYAPDVGWGYSIGIDVVSSDYGDVEPARDEDLLQVDARVIRNTASGWQLFAGVLRGDNDSSDPAFSYQRNQVSIGVYRLF